MSDHEVRFTPGGNSCLNLQTTHASTTGEMGTPGIYPAGGCQPEAIRKSGDLVARSVKAVLSEEHFEAREASRSAAAETENEALAAAWDVEHADEIAAREAALTARIARRETVAATKKSKARSGTTTRRRAAAA